MPLNFKRHKTAIVSSAIVLATASFGGWYYVFVAGAPQLDPPKAERFTGLKLQVNTFYSQAMQSERRYGYILPPGYDSKSDKRYPVIFLLHGGHGNEYDYEKKAAITSILHDLYKSKKLPPSLVITPDGNDRRGSSPLWDSDYTDSENGNIATLIGVDVVNDVKAKFKTIEEPELWAIGGLSSGAWGAFNIGLKFPNTFTILFSHTGYFFERNRIKTPDNSPSLAIERLPPEQLKRLRVYLDAGESDAEFLDTTREFSLQLDRLGVQNEFHIFPGGHGIVGQDVGWNYWHKHLKDSLGYVGRQFVAAHEAEAHHLHQHSSDHFKDHPRTAPMPSEPMPHQAPDAQAPEPSPHPPTSADPEPPDQATIDQ